jgi:hypothetical protein
VPIVGPGLEDKGGELCGGREELRKRVGMDSDVWTSELSEFIFDNIINIDICILILFNVNVKWMYSYSIF